MKYRYCLPALFFLLVTIGASSTHADCFILLPGQGMKFTQEVRNKLAQDLLDRINEVNHVIPELSPKEKEWLDKELKSGDLDRWVKAGNTTENKFLATKALLNRTIDKLTWLTVPNVNSRPLKQQVVTWAALVYELIDIDVWEELGVLHVRKQIQIPGVLKNMHQMDPATHCARIAEHVQVGIIIPYLLGDLK